MLKPLKLFTQGSMDPLTAIALAGAGFVYATRKPKADDGAEREPSQPNPIAGRRLSPAALQLFVTGVIDAEVKDATLGSVDHTQSDIEAGLKSQIAGNMTLSIVTAVIVAVSAVALFIFFAYVEVDRLSKGRKWYAEQLRSMARAAIASLQTALNASPLSEQQRKDFCNLFGYYLARGFNRANVNRCSMLTGNLLDVVGNLPYELRIGYWADRAMCIPEAGYVQSMNLRNAGLRALAPLEDSIEYTILDGNTCDETEGRLRGVWHVQLEGVADFVGRAIACTSILNQQNAPRPDNMVTMGCIGLQEPTGVAIAELQVSQDSGHGWLDVKGKQYVDASGDVIEWTREGYGAVMASSTMPDGSLIYDGNRRCVNDGTRRTMLSWFYEESKNMQHAVVR